MCLYKARYLLINKSSVCLGLVVVTVDRALEGVDHMVVGVVLVIVQYTEVHVLLHPIDTNQELH